MNPSKHLTPEERARWQGLWDLLDSIRLAPLPAPADADELLAELPPRRPEETLPGWLERAGRAARYTLEDEFERKAAYSGMESHPLPELPMRSLNGRFTLAVAQQDGRLALRLGASGPARYRHRNSEVFLGQKDGGGFWLAVALDGQGAGTAWVDDGPAARQALARLCVFAKKPGHAE